MLNIKNHDISNQSDISKIILINQNFLLRKPQKYLSIPSNSLLLLNKFIQLLFLQSNLFLPCLLHKILSAASYNLRKFYCVIEFIFRILINHLFKFFLFLLRYHSQRLIHFFIRQLFIKVGDNFLFCLEVLFVLFNLRLIFVASFFMFLFHFNIFILLHLFGICALYYANVSNM